MQLDLYRRRALRMMNSRYIYGRMPLLHAVIFVIQLMVTMRLATKFNSYYAERPVLTTMITNAVLGGIADTVAQTLTCLRTKRRTSYSRDDFVSIEIDDLDEKHAANLNFNSPTADRDRPRAFDFERLTRFMAYGFMMAPIQFQWFGFLSRAFPIVKGSGTSAALKRVAMDQLVFAPVGLAAFFTFMTVVEGGGKRAVARKFQDVYMPALKANYMLWPLVQVMNFRVVPIQFQIPFVSTIGIAWTAYLSLTNSE